jgi:1,4-dihydroxy-6-naphthoate synthase
LKTINIAHSPDADDIFMYYAIKFGWVSDDKYLFKNKALDIESLNEHSILGTYDISAISFALYPYIKDDYALLRTASSFGNGYGPKLIRKKNTKLTKKFSLALSGKWTTNAFLAKIYYPDAIITYMNFLDIENAIKNNEVDAGVLIHESILTFSDDFIVEKEIFDIWKELINKDIPLPLGGMAIRRSIPLMDAINCEDMLSKAIKVGVSNRKMLNNMLIERNLLRVDGKLLDKYLDMYANNQSILMEDNEINSLNELYALGYKHNVYNQEMDINKYFIPKEYKKLRL